MGNFVALRSDAQHVRHTLRHEVVSERPAGTLQEAGRHGTATQLPGIPAARVGSHHTCTSIETGSIQETATVHGPGHNRSY